MILTKPPFAPAAWYSYTNTCSYTMCFCTKRYTIWYWYLYQHKFVLFFMLILITAQICSVFAILPSIWYYDIEYFYSTTLSPSVIHQSSRSYHIRFCQGKFSQSLKRSEAPGLYPSVMVFDITFQPHQIQSESSERRKRAQVGEGRTVKGREIR